MSEHDKAADRHPLRLRLGGRFAALDTGGGEIAVPLRGAAILAYLALQPGRRAARDALAALIWPDRGEEQARASLRQELAALRRALPGGAISADRLEVWLDEHAVAVDTAGGQFLNGFGLRSGAFDDWLRDARGRLGNQRLAAALAAGEDALTRGDAQAAAAAARDAQQIDPCSERAARLLMRAETARGDRAAALTAFNRLAEVLKRDLDAAPGPETLSLAEDLRAPLPDTARKPAAAPPGRRPVLAVLPFPELGLTAHDMFADGIVEEITSALSRTDAFDVIARQSAFALGADAADARVAAARLGADYIVEGTVRRSGDRVRLNAQLVDGASGVTLWTERFDDRLDDLFDLQDRIAMRVAGHLAPHLRMAEIARADRRPASERTAYELVLTALPRFWAHRREDNDAAIAMFGAALETAPDYAPAMAYRAWALCQRFTYQWSRDLARDKADARQLVERAAPLAGDRPATLVAVAAAVTLLSDDFDLARRYIDRALALDPNNAWAWLRAGWCSIYQGQPQRALDELDRAELLSPLDPFRFNILFGRAGALRKLGRRDEAVDLIRQGMREGPGVTWAYRMLYGTLKLAGRDAEANEAARLWRAAYPALSVEQMVATIPLWSHEPEYTEALARIVDEDI